jgi:hypothetical protein
MSSNGDNCRQVSCFQVLPAMLQIRTFLDLNLEQAPTLRLHKLLGGGAHEDTRSGAAP